MNRVEEPLAVIHASIPRRVMGVGTLWALGALLLWLAGSQSYDHPAYQALMLVFAVAAIWAGERLRRATQRSLYLTRDDLRDSSGRILARLEDVVAVDRGAFAFKPSNGFLLRLKVQNGRAWQPGLWWRMGSRVGVGGVTAAGEAKAVAELITAQLHARTEEG